MNCLRDNGDFGLPSSQLLCSINIAAVKIKKVITINRRLFPDYQFSIFYQCRSYCFLLSWLSYSAYARARHLTRHPPSAATTTSLQVRSLTCRTIHKCSDHYTRKYYRHFCAVIKPSGCYGNNRYAKADLGFTFLNLLGHAIVGPNMFSTTIQSLNNTALEIYL